MDVSIPWPSFLLLMNAMEVMLVRHPGLSIFIKLLFIKASIRLMIILNNIKSRKSFDPF